MSPSPRAADSRLHRLHHAAIAASLLLAACGQAGAPQFPPPDVSVAPVVRRSVTEWDDYSGHIEAIESAEIRPRVAGHLNRVHYREGGLVEKDQLLFTIDDREYRAAADAARADLVRAKARLTLARQELARGEALVKPGNLVTPNQALLTTLVSIDPVYVTFEGDERAYLRYQELARGGGR